MPPAVVAAIALYSASVEDWATVVCFLELQLTGLEPKKMTYAEVETLESISPVQSASVKTRREGVGMEERNNPK